MAQGDLFSDLMNNTGLWGDALKQGVIDTKQLRDIQEEIVEQQKNIYEIKRDMLKSDYKGINIFKRIASSGSKILAQTEKIHKTKKSIQNTEKRLAELAKDYGKAKKLGNSFISVTTDKDLLKNFSVDFDGGDGKRSNYSLLVCFVIDFDKIRKDEFEIDYNNPNTKKIIAQLNKHSGRK